MTGVPTLCSSDLNNIVECRGQLEKEAHTLQDEWLQEKYGVNVWDTIQINQLFFVMITSCMTGIPDPEMHWEKEIMKYLNMGNEISHIHNFDFTAV